MKFKLKPMWILLLIGAVLLFAVFGTRREFFNPATERPSPSDPGIRNMIKNTVGISDDTDPRIGAYITAIQNYYDTKFLPEKTSNSMKVAQFVNEQTDTTIDKQKLSRMLSSLFLMADNTGTFGISSSSTYSYSSTNPRPICSSPGFIYNDGQAKCGMSELKPAQGSCPEGFTSDGPVCVKTEAATCPSGFTFSMEAGRGVCKPSASASSPPASSSTPAAASTGSKFSQRIWGPPFVGTGQAGSGNGDSTKNTTYPQLLGGDAGKYEGGDGSKIEFPSLGSLGLNANANFFPFSRSPGDMDVIADPYRVSNTFSAASYSPTPAPAPFLTDFSAFQ